MFTLLMGLTIVVLAMFLLGWLDFARSETEAAVRIKTGKIRQDVRSSLANARRFVRRIHRRADHPQHDDVSGQTHRQERRESRGPLPDEYA